MIVRRRTRIIAALVMVVVALSAYAAVRADAIAVGMMIAPPQRLREPLPRPSDVREVLAVERAGAELRAWVFDPTQTPRGTVVILHGIRDSKIGSLLSARTHAQRGYRAVIADSRGHGESTGKYLTYGVEEARDVRSIVDRLAQLGSLAEPLCVIGSSYGASTAVQYAAIDPRVGKLVAISPFASLREVVPAYLRWMLGGLAALVPQRWVNARIDEAGRIASFDPDRACPRCAAPQVRAPTLIIASRADERIPYQQSVAVREAIGARTKLMLVDGARHVVVGGADGVQDAIAHWIDARD